MTTPSKHDPIQGEIIHEYDGILEADNVLPRWWLMTFYGAVVFAIGYWFYYEEFKAGPSPLQAYFAEQSAAAEKNGIDPSETELNALASGASLELGKKLYAANCVACHEARGQGKIGPNLTDAAWLHGADPVAIFKTVRDGVAAKGMPSWGPTLGRSGVSQVAAYVLTLRNTNVPGRPPEGVLESSSAQPSSEPTASTP
jgi:cytochrome c oxidase cbb3-type subunit 3